MRLYRRGDPGYEEARCAAVWNGRIPDRYPDLIAIAADRADVVAAVRLARERGLRIGVGSGGHNWIGAHVRDGGMLLDVSGLRDVEIDGDRAWAGPGTTGNRLDEALRPRGLFFPLGHCSDVAIGGYLLSGGYGWNSRVVGPACASVEAVEVVTADGSVVISSDRHDPDLVWAVRGGGPGFFGVITRYLLRLHPRPPMVRTTQIYPVSLAGEVIRWSMRAPLDPALEVTLYCTDREAILTGTAIAPDPARPLGVMETVPVLDRATRVERAVPGELADFWAGAAETTPKGRRYAADCLWTAAGPDRFVPAAERVIASIPTPASQILWQVWGADQDAGNAAWGLQAPWYFALYAAWDDPADDARIQRWVTGSVAGMADLSAGVQWGDADPVSRPDRALTGEDAHRWDLLRAARDPEGRFHGRPG